MRVPGAAGCVSISRSVHGLTPCARVKTSPFDTRDGFIPAERRPAACSCLRASPRSGTSLPRGTWPAPGSPKRGSPRPWLARAQTAVDRTWKDAGLPCGAEPGDPAGACVLGQACTTVHTALMPKLRGSPQQVSPHTPPTPRTGRARPLPAPAFLGVARVSGSLGGGDR